MEAMMMPVEKLEAVVELASDINNTKLCCLLG